MFRLYSLLFVGALSGWAYAKADFNTVLCSPQTVNAWSQTPNFTINEVNEKGQNALTSIVYWLSIGGRPTGCDAREYYHNLLNVVLELLRKGININAKDNIGYTALMYAAGIKGERPFQISFGSKPEYARIDDIAFIISTLLLVEPNIDMTARGHYDGKTAALLAAQSNNREILRLLALKGADMREIRDPALIAYLQQIMQQRARGIPAT